MTDMDKEINNLIMQEIGLEINSNNQIVDQDTGVALQLNGMNVIAPGCYGGRQSIEFDPYNNRKMMSQLFGYFMDKYSEETDLDVIAHYGVENDTMVECKMSDNSAIRSKAYKRDSLKYTDIIMQMNGESDVNLNKYDTLSQNESVKRATKR